MGKLIVLSTFDALDRVIKNGQNLHLDSASEDASIFILITLAHTCIKIELSEQKIHRPSYLV